MSALRFYRYFTSLSSYFHIINLCFAIFTVQNYGHNPVLFLELERVVRRMQSFLVYYGLHHGQSIDPPSSGTCWQVHWFQDLGYYEK